MARLGADVLEDVRSFGELEARCLVADRKGQGETRSPAAFITGPFEERGGIFSPNGRWVAYVSNKSGQNDVFVRPYPGPGGEVTISVGGGREPVWGPSGKQLFYRHAGKLLSVRIEEVAGALKVGPPVALFDDTFRPDTGGAAGGMANYDIAPDGQHFVVVEDQRQNDPAGARLQVILNWFEELKARVPTKQLVQSLLEPVPVGPLP